jgi:hypothetical protein
MNGHRRGHGTIALLVILAPLALGAIVLVWFGVRLVEDRRSQQAADAAAMTAAQVVASRANAIAAMNEAAAEAMAHAALASAVCGAWRYGDELEDIPSDLARALEDAGEVCQAEEGYPSISGRYHLAACHLLTESDSLFENLDADAAAGASAAAEDLGATQVGLAPHEDILDADRQPVDVLCERAGEHLSSLLADTDFAACTGSTEGWSVYRWTRSSAWASLASLCAGSGCLAGERVVDLSDHTETRLLAWVRTPVLWQDLESLDAPEGPLAGVSAAGSIAQDKRGEGPLSRSWFARLGPVQRSVQSISADRRPGAPDLHWELLEH